MYSSYLKLTTYIIIDYTKKLDIPSVNFYDTVMVDPL